MKFLRYNKIINSYLIPEDFTESNSDLANGDWVVTTKIHGANFAFYSNGADDRIAKRSSFCDGGFFNCKEVVEKYQDKVRALAKEIIRNNQEVAYVIVFGELYGKGIQKELDYGEKDFVAFDLAIVDANDVVRFENKIVALEMIKQFEIPAVPVVAYGNFSAVMAVDPNKNTCNLTKSGDLEGYVISPCEDVRDEHDNRIVFKWKTEAFMEKKDKKPKTPKEVGAHIAKHVEEALQMVTLNRLSNVVSHEGKTKISNFSKLLHAFTGDVIEELNCQDLNKMQLNQVKKIITSECAKVIKENPSTCFEM